MELSKACDCIPHDLIIAKLAAYGLDDTASKLIFSYLKNRKQCARINNTYSNFENIISGVPQGSIVSPLLFEFDLFFFIESSSIHNFISQQRKLCLGQKSTLLEPFASNLPDVDAVSSTNVEVKIIDVVALVNMVKHTP